MSTDSSTAIARRHTKPFYSLRPDAKRPKFDYSLFEPIEVLHPISKDNAAVSNLIVSPSAHQVGTLSMLSVSSLLATTM